MVVHADKKKRQQLGQFFTPFKVVNFIYDMVWPLLKGKKQPRIIDPACGDGLFLLEALERFKASKRKFEPRQIVGCDIDSSLEGFWVENGLYLEAQMYPGQNGIYGEDKTGSRAHLIEDGSFDLAIGNPPFGGVGIKHLDELVKLIQLKNAVGAEDGSIVVQTELFDVQRDAEVVQPDMFKEDLKKGEQHLKKDADLDDLRLLSKVLKHKFQVWRKNNTTGNNGLMFNITNPAQAQSRLDNSLLIRIGGVEFNGFDILSEKEVRRLSSFPIEVLFVERFLQLVKAGGFVAIIIPDGILANATMQHVRNFIAERARVRAIVSLPRGVFKAMGTNAKTSILILEKLDPSDDNAVQDNYQLPVFLAIAEKLDRLPESLDILAKKFTQFGETGTL